MNWTASSEFGTYCLCEQRRFRRACASAQSRQNLRYSLIQAVSQEEPSERKPDPRPLWMAGHAQLKFVMTECSKTQTRLTGLNWYCQVLELMSNQTSLSLNDKFNKNKTNLSWRWSNFRITNFFLCTNWIALPQWWHYKINKCSLILLKYWTRKERASLNK